MIWGTKEVELKEEAKNRKKKVYDTNRMNYLPQGHGPANEQYTLE